MIHVLIVEDDPMARQLLEIYVNKSENYTLVQSVESATLAEFCCRTNQIDLILMDVCTAMNASGLEAAERIKQQLPGIKIIIITSQPECTFIDRARAIGTFETSSLPYEDCCTVFTPKHPQTKPKLAKVEEEESKLDVEGLIERALAGVHRTTLG